MSRPISPAGLDKLAAYRYRAGEWSVLDHVLDKWWSFAAELLPLWLAPNLVTLIGLVALASTVPVGLLTATTCGGGGGGEPYLSPSANLFVAAALFLYQTLDAVDGKQARRTGSSSPLGQLFDHGCDAVAACVIGWNACQAVGLGSSRESFLVFSAILVSFFLAQWEEAHSHTLHSNVKGVGVTEGQVFLILFHVAAALLPCTVWSAPHAIPSLVGSVLGDGAATAFSSSPLLHPLSHLSVAHLLAYTATAVIGAAGLWLLYSVVVKQGHGESVPQLTGLVAAVAAAAALFLEPTRGALVSVTTDAATRAVASGPVADAHPKLLFLAFCLAVTGMTTRMIVCSMTGDRFPVVQRDAFLFALVTVLPAAVPSLRTHVHTLLLAYIALAAADYFEFVAACMDQITERLGIRAFVIAPRAAGGAGAGGAPAAAAAEEEQSEAASTGGASAASGRRPRAASRGAQEKPKVEGGDEEGEGLEEEESLGGRSSRGSQRARRR